MSSKLIKNPQLDFEFCRITYLKFEEKYNEDKPARAEETIGSLAHKLKTTPHKLAKTILEHPVLSTKIKSANPGRVVKKSHAELLCKEFDIATDVLIKPDPNRIKPLTKEHYELFLKLIRLMNKQIWKTKKMYPNMEEEICIDPKNPPVLKTNNHNLKEACSGKTVKSTVWRWLKRLQEAGVIVKKINHGNNDDYDIVFNPNFLVWKDLENSDYLPQSSIFKTTEKFALLASEIAKRNQIAILKDSNNKRINNVDKVSGSRQMNLRIHDKGLRHVSEIFKDSFFRDSHKDDCQNGQSQQVNDKQLLFEKKLEKFRWAGAVWTFNLYRKHLEKYAGEGKIYENPTYISAIIANIKRDFFDEIQTRKKIERMYQRISWCVNKAIEIVEHKRMKGEPGYIQFPNLWFDPQNTKSGLIGLFPKYQQYIDRKKGRAYNKMMKERILSGFKKPGNYQVKATNRQKYVAAIHNLFGQEWDLKKTESYIRKNIPQFFEEFIDTVVKTKQYVGNAVMYETLSAE